MTVTSNGGISSTDSAGDIETSGREGRDEELWLRGTDVVTTIDEKRDRAIDCIGEGPLSDRQDGLVAFGNDDGSRHVNESDPVA